MPSPAVHVHVPLPRPALELACALAHATGRDVIALEVRPVPVDAMSVVHQSWWSPGNVLSMPFGEAL